MGGTASTIIIVIILAVILFFAVKSSISHFRGEGGCCGGSGKEKRIKPAKLDNVIAMKRVKIKGMRCENCNIRVQNALNRVEGISAKVYGERQEAVVQMGREIDDSEIRKIIDNLGYNVESIENL